MTIKEALIALYCRFVEKHFNLNTHIILLISNLLNKLKLDKIINIEKYLEDLL
jgi:hypothetical protein